MSMPACCFRRSMRDVGPLNWAPGVAGTPSHLPSILPRYCRDRAGRAVLLDQRLHDVVHRHELIWVSGTIPAPERQDVVARPRLRLGGRGQDQLVALRCDEVDLQVDLLLLGPRLGHGLGALVGARHPMVPQADRELAGGIAAPRTNGAATMADERAAVLVTKRRRPIVLLVMCVPPVVGARVDRDAWPFRPCAEC